MAIPGLKASHDIRAKVRVGEKRNGKPASTDYFLCDDADFARVAGAKPATLRIRFLQAQPDDVWTTGLEWWHGSMLACFSGDQEGEALRVESKLRPDDQRLDDRSYGRDRARILCRFRDCPVFTAGKCKPQGRLTFFLDGGRPDAVYRFETKGWNTIENLTGALTAAAASGPLTGRVFELSVVFSSSGNKRFPEINLKEVDPVVPINTDQDVSVADAAVQAHKAIAEGAPANRTLAALLDVYRPGWRDDEAYVARVKEITPEAALTATLDRIAKELA